MLVLKTNWPVHPRIKTCITTRQSGVSHKPWDSLNLATHVNDKTEDVIKNRDILRAILPDEPVWLDQQHTTKCIQIPHNQSKTPIADGSFTQKEKIICSVLTADCLPLLICDNKATFVCAIHAGWKGLAEGIVEKSINQLLYVNKSCSQDLLVYLGPAISQANFEVGIEVKTQFTNKYPDTEIAFISKKPQKFLCDLYQLAKIILNHLGITQIYSDDYCTYRDQDKFFSYRRDGVTGRIASMIWMDS